MQVHSTVVFMGKIRLRYRYRDIGFAIKCLWNALRGYGVSIQNTIDESAPDENPSVAVK